MTVVKLKTKHQWLYCKPINETTETLQKLKGVNSSIGMFKIKLLWDRSSVAHITAGQKTDGGFNQIKVSALKWQFTPKNF